MNDELERIRKAREKFKQDNEPRNKQFNLTEGHLYRIHSRNLPYGVYDGRSGFIGIREKFGGLFLFTEYDYDDGPPFGTVIVKEDLGPIPPGIELVEGRLNEDKKQWDSNKPLYDFLASAEAQYGGGVGYGDRSGDQEG